MVLLKAITPKHLLQTCMIGRALMIEVNLPVFDIIHPQYNKHILVWRSGQEVTQNVMTTLLDTRTRKCISHLDHLSLFLHSKIKWLQLSSICVSYLFLFWLLALLVELLASLPYYVSLPQLWEIKQTCHGCTVRRIFAIVDIYITTWNTRRHQATEESLQLQLEMKQGLLFYTTAFKDTVWC